MTTPDDPVFDELKTALHEADSVPDDVLQAAKDSFTWRTVDAELAELVFDSALEELSGVRSGATVDRQLTFRTDEFEIEILHSEGTITGQLIPPQVGQVELTADGKTSHASVDDLGSFRFEDVAAGHVRLSVRVGDETVVTEWTVL